MDEEAESQNSKFKSRNSKFISDKESLTKNDTHDTSLTTAGANIHIITNDRG